MPASARMNITAVQGRQLTSKKVCSQQKGVPSIVTLRTAARHQMLLLSSVQHAVLHARCRGFGVSR